MSGPQFVHIETYAMAPSALRRGREAARAAEGKVIDRKLSVEEICGEAARLAGHHPHVANPRPPVLLLGVTPEVVPDMLRGRIDKANAHIRDRKKALPRGQRSQGARGIRSDTHVLLTWVVSYPVPWKDDGSGRPSLEDPAELALYQQWRERNVAWSRGLTSMLGVDVLSLVEHTDEEYPHAHGMGIAHHERLEARSVHPGYAAKRAVERLDGEDEKAFKKRQDKAYCDAMRAFQDGYFEAVGKDAGLTRIGPARRRLARGQWLSEKTQAKAVGEANLRRTQLNDAILQEHVRLREMETSTAAAAVEIQDQAAALTRLMTLQKDAERLRIEAHSEAEAIAAVRKKLAHGVLEQTADVVALGERKEGLEEELQRIIAQLDEATERKRKATEEAETKARAILNEAERARAALLESLVEWDKHLRLRDTEIREKEAAAERRMNEADAIVEGVLAYADGRLRFNPANDVAPFQVSRADADLHRQLAPVKSRLLPIISALDGRLAQRARMLGSALAAAVRGWAVGRIRSSGEQGVEFADDEEAKRLAAIVNPFRIDVAIVVRMLPSLSEVRSMLRTVTRLGHRLTDEERQEAAELREAVERLHKRTTDRTD